MNWVQKKVQAYLQNVFTDHFIKYMYVLLEFGIKWPTIVDMA